MICNQLTKDVAILKALEDINLDIWLVDFSSETVKLLSDVSLYELNTCYKYAFYFEVLQDESNHST